MKKVTLLFGTCAVVGGLLLAGPYLESNSAVPAVISIRATPVQKVPAPASPIFCRVEKNQKQICFSEVDVAKIFLLALVEQELKTFR